MKKLLKSVNKPIAIISLIVALWLCSLNGVFGAAVNEVVRGIWFGTRNSAVCVELGRDRLAGSTTFSKTFPDTADSQYDIILVQYETASNVWNTIVSGVTYTDADADGRYETISVNCGDGATAGGEVIVLGMNFRGI